MPTASEQHSVSSSLSYAIGEMSISWGVAEFGMSLLLRELMGTDMLTALAISASMDYAKRRDLLNSVAQFKLTTTKVPFNDLMSDLAGVSKERNAIIHGLFAEIDGKTLRMNINNRGLLVAKETNDSPKRILGLARRISAAANKMPPLSESIRDDVKAWREKHPEAFVFPDQELLTLALLLAGCKNKQRTKE